MRREQGQWLRFFLETGCQLVIDRDSVSYGFILSAKGRPVTKTYNSVHGGDYLGELDEYFSLRRSQ